jgi:hypothetical protein
MSSLTRARAYSDGERAGTGGAEPVRRVLCEVEETELDGDYSTVEGVCATCSRCGHETESYGTTDASVKRCLAMLRDECPNGERNFYIAGASRPSAVETAYRNGYANGLRDGARRTMALDAHLLRDLVQLCHPDRHPVERAAIANRVTARLLELLEREREAA